VAALPVFTFLGVELLVDLGTTSHDGTIYAELSLTATFDATSDELTITHEGGNSIHGDVGVVLTVTDGDSGTTAVPIVTASSAGGLAKPPIKVGDTVTVPSVELRSRGQLSAFDDGDRLVLRFVTDGGNETYRLGRIDGQQVSKLVVPTAAIHEAYVGAVSTTE
jgi:hypothetical protein